jgi:hypothetical protein
MNDTNKSKEVNSTAEAANETIQGLLSCVWCSSSLEEPVMLPCGETVCFKHEATFKNGDGECELCGETHELDTNKHFPLNKIAQGMIDNRIKDLNLGENHRKAAESLKELSKFLDRFEHMKASGQKSINEFFQKQRSKVNLTREELIRKLIVRCCEELLGEIDDYENECTLNLAHLNELYDSDLASIKSNLVTWQTEIKHLVMNEKLWRNINEHCERYLEILKEKHRSFENSMFLGKSNKAQIESSFSDVFDRFGRNLGFLR